MTRFLPILALLLLVVSLRPDGTVAATEAAPMPGPTQLPGG